MSDGETAPGKAKDAAGKQRTSGHHIPGGQGLKSFGQRSRSVESFSKGSGRTSDPVEPSKICSPEH